MAVVGSSGAMGAFFSRYFLWRGFAVAGSDIRKGRLPGMKFTPSNQEAVSDADVILVATPMQSTLRVCEGFAGSMRKGSTIVEMASVKGDLPRRLAVLARKRGGRLLSIHPLFGPSLADYDGMKICVVREHNDGSSKLAKNLFPEARLVSMTAEEHDRLMALNLSLTHLVNIAYAKVIAENLKRPNFLATATPSSYLQGTLAEGVLSQDPALVSGILFSNRFAPQYLEQYSREFSRLLAMLGSGRDGELRSEHRRLSKSLSASARSMKKVYRAVSAVKSAE